MKKIRKMMAWLLLCTLFGTGVFGGSAYADTEICETAVVYDEILPAEEVAEVVDVEEVPDAKETRSAFAQEAETVEEETLLKASPAVNTATQSIYARYQSANITNSSVTDVQSYWPMLAAKSFGLSKTTGTDYTKVDFKTLGTQKLAKMIMAMINDGVNPGDYYAGDQDVVSFALSLMGYDGGFVNYAAGETEVTCSEQATMLQALYAAGAEVPQTAADFLKNSQDSDGILSIGSSKDYDTTCWCMTACKLLGIKYPNADKAETALQKAASDMNSNAYACWLSYLSACGKLTETEIETLISKFYDTGSQMFTFNGTANELATHQCSIALGEFVTGKSVYKALQESSTYKKKAADSAEITVRICEATDSGTTDLVKRVPLTVVKDSCQILTGIKGSFEGVTLADVLTEAVAYSILGHDPSAEELRANATKINTKLNISFNTYYNSYSIVDLLGKGSSVSYYTNRTNQAAGITDPVHSGDDAVFFLFTDGKQQYGTFDAADYFGMEGKSLPVTVSMVTGYDKTTWKPVFAPVPAAVTAKGTAAEKTFRCDEKGTADLKGLPAGTYDLTANYTDASGVVMVSPYASLEILTGKENDVSVTVRICEAKSADTTIDHVKRISLRVEKGTSRILSGVTDDFTDVTLLDVLTAAVGYNVTGSSNVAKSKLFEKKEVINAKVKISNGQYGYGIDDLFGKGNYFGYYLNRTEMAYALSDPVKNGDDVVFFIYDYTKQNYAAFDKKEYSVSKGGSVNVTVSQLGYDASWNPVFAPIPAVVKATSGSTSKTFQANANGIAKIEGLASGTYDLTASYTDAYGMYIVSPYATLTVSGTSGGGGGYVLTAAAAAVPFTTKGSWDAPVTGGTWMQDTSGKWSYQTTELFRNCWAYIENPYAVDGQPKNAWFLFDAAGKMLTGWQQVDGKWYYLIPDSNGTMGACLLGTVTPDGYTVDENGAWIESIPQTAEGIVYAAAQKAAAAEAAAKTAVTAATSVVTTAASTGSSSVGSNRVVYGGSGSGSSAGTTSSKGKVSVSLSANVTTTDGKKVSFSGSKSYTVEEGETYTAYDLLTMLCADKGWDLDGDSNYISGINGLYEFDAGKQSGWMYSVGGKYPNVPAGDYEVEIGKTVKWTYVTKMVTTSD